MNYYIPFFKNELSSNRKKTNHCVWWIQGIIHSLFKQSMM